MSTRTRVVQAPAATIWDVLADGWLFPLWVVGASRIREVDDAWPEQGSRIHHSVGSWPLLIDDHSEVLEVRPPVSLRLRARGWPAGEAEVHLQLEQHGASTHVTITEDAVGGPGRLVPHLLRTPLLDVRNDETLRRLAYVAERR